MSTNKHHSALVIFELISELQYIAGLIEDGNMGEAIDELECQSGTIETIIKGYEDA